MAGRTCTCNTGYMGDGETCTSTTIFAFETISFDLTLPCADINACTTNACDANAACADLPPPLIGTAGRTCTCNAGYTGNGETCSGKSNTAHRLFLLAFR